MLATVPKSAASHRSPSTRSICTIILLLILGVLLLFVPLGHAALHMAAVPDLQMTAMPEMNRADPNSKCDDMGSHMSSMSVMGQSMAAMTNHMCITPQRPAQPGDEEKVKDLLEKIKTAIEKYKDYKKALADGYVIANPKVEQPQYHFTNDAYVRLADTQFDPTKPSSLLYWHTSTQRYRLEGVMYTDSTSATLNELNQRIPLSIARWHEHTNFCAAPANKVSEYHGESPKFGMFGSIHTAEACKAAGGTFFPVMFSWMIHVFPYETDLKDVFSMNDDVPHVH
jgi:hypothetical protein